MKKENTATRLKKIMSDENLRQVDILAKTMPYCEKYDVKMNKSDLSQYCSGKTEPNQDKLFVLSLALNVNEAWLMGFNVPMKRDSYEDQKIITHDAIWDEAEELLQQAGYKLHEIVEISYQNGNLASKSIDTVKSRLFLARMQLQALLTRDGKRRID